MNPFTYLKNLNKFGSKGGYNPGLQRVEKLLSKLGHPQKELAIIHVAGTNGKGSTIAFINSIYQHAGYSVGVFTSPALFQENEMIQINDNNITEEELAEVIEIIDPYVEDLKHSDLGKPSFFEVMTAIAFLYFQQKQVDLVLLEVGLGGKEDATNVIQKPLISVITGIGLEHTAILGDSLEDIARAKAGIIKRGIPVISGVEKKEALTVIKDNAVEKKSRLILLNDNYPYQVLDSDLRGQTFKVMIERDRWSRYEIGLMGVYQVRNAITAVAVVKELTTVLPVSENNIENGLKEARLCCRMEVISREPLILLDGAHNEEGMKSLVTFLKNQVSGDRKLTIVLSILQDKNIKAMIQALTELEKLNLIITRNRNSRALSPEKIKRVADEFGISSKIYADMKKVLSHIFNNTVPGEIFCITGSLYTAAEAKILLKSFSGDGINFQPIT